MQQLDSLVVIHWYETKVYSAQPGGAYRSPSPSVVHAVGWVTYEDDTHIEIRSAYADESSSTSERTISALLIPKGAIIYMAKLAVEKPVSARETELNDLSDMLYYGAAKHAEAKRPEITPEKLRELVKAKLFEMGLRQDKAYVDPGTETLQANYAAERAQSAAQPVPHDANEDIYAGVTAPRTSDLTASE